MYHTAGLNKKSNLTVSVLISKFNLFILIADLFGFIATILLWDYHSFALLPFSLFLPIMCVITLFTFPPLLLYLLLICRFENYRLHFCYFSACPYCTFG